MGFEDDDDTFLAQEYNVLVEHGAKIIVVEVAGPLFFGTYDRLAAHVDDLVSDEPRTIILDFSRVFDIDSTASQLLLQTVHRARNKGVQLIFSTLATNPQFAAFMANQPLLKQLSSRELSAALNDALSTAEDDLIEAHNSTVLEHADAKRVGCTRSDERICHTANDRADDARFV